MNKTIYLLNRSMQHTLKHAAWMISIILMFLFLPEAKAGTQTQYDQAEWPDGAPFVSPYALKADYGAKPIVKLAKVGYFEPRYFQFIVSEEGGGNKALTMVWKKEAIISGKTINAHYELALEDLTNTDPERVRLDRTLWKVRAKKDPNSQVLYYTLINKASQLPLQLSENADASIPLEIVDGSTDWLWSDAAEAVSGSKFDNTVTRVLQGSIRAINATTTLYLVKNEDGDVAVEFVNNSNGSVSGNVITFEAWEANPIILTAEQINAKLGYEDVTTQNKGTEDSFKFTFSPDVEGPNATNVMTSYSFKAEAPKPAAEREAGDPTDGYVRFQALDGDEETGKYLMVDTAYHDAEINDNYDLQIAVKKIEAPEYAMIADGGEVGTYSKIAVAQLKRQSNFKPVFYPSTQSLRLQVEMMFKADKKRLKNHPNASQPFEVSWWGQMYYALTSGQFMQIVNMSNSETYWNTSWGAGYFEPFSKESIQVLTWGTFGTDPLGVVKSLTYYYYTDWYAGKTDGGQHFARPKNNVVKLTTLTNSPKHTVLTCDVRDADDEANADGHGGLLTYISLEGLLSADHLDPLTLPNDASTITISYADDVWSYKDDDADAVGFNGTIKCPENSNSTDRLIITSVAGNPTLTFDKVKLKPTNHTGLTIQANCELTLKGSLNIDVAAPDDGETYYCIDNSGKLTVADPFTTGTEINLHSYNIAINNASNGTLNNAWMEWRFATAMESGTIILTSDDISSRTQASHTGTTFATVVIPCMTYKYWISGGVGALKDSKCQQGKAKDGNTYVIYYPAPAGNGVAVFTDVKEAVSVTVTPPTGGGGSISVFCNDSLLAENDYVPDGATLACRYNALPGYKLESYTATPGTDPSTPNDVSTSATYQVPGNATSIAIAATFGENPNAVVKEEEVIASEPTSKVNKPTVVISTNDRPTITDGSTIKLITGDLEEAQQGEVDKVLKDVAHNKLIYAEIALVEEKEDGTKIPIQPTANHPVTVIYPYPSGTTSSDIFTIVHLKTDGTTETYSVADGNLTNATAGLTFEVSSFSPFGIAWTKNSTTDPDDPGTTPDPDPAPTVYYTVVIPALEGATTDPVAGAYEVEAWDSFRFYLTLDADYDQSAPVVTTDRGETIEPRSSDGAYIIRYVRTPVEISIAGIQKNADVANATILSGTRVWTEPSAVCLETDRTEEVRIVSLAGTTVAAFTAQPGTTRQTLAPGAYVVKMGRAVYKVIVR